jgi:flagellar FliJ protein
MKRSKRLEPISNIASKEERKAAEAFGKAQQALDLAKEKLEQLVGYKSEYQNKLHQKAANGISGVELMDYHRFIVQLDQAIGSQRQKVAESTMAFEDNKSNWQNKYSRSSAMKQVVNLHRNNEAAIESKHEQKVMDEFAARKHQSSY